MTTPTDRVTPRPILLWFAEQMELALRRNDHKGGWHNCEPLALVRRVGQETKELREAIEDYGPPHCGCREAGCPHARILTPNEGDVIREAADVGAMAMMVADHFRDGGPSKDQGLSAMPYATLPIDGWIVAIAEEDLPAVTLVDFGHKGARAAGDRPSIGYTQGSAKKGSPVVVCLLGPDHEEDTDDDDIC